MPLTLCVLKETIPGEARVALTPETVKKLIALGVHVSVQAGAGVSAAYLDDAYRAAGATITDSESILAQADVILGVQAPGENLFTRMKRGAIVIGFVYPHRRPEIVEQARAAGVTLMAMERVPRITRAQSMDALSSQSNLAGYRAVIEAAGYYGRAMPMMMTAAGTIAPARVFVMGTGVAGLQAIATARRLGAIVSATDVRAVAREQVESLGANFVMLEDDEVKNAETAGGYAREMSDDFKQKQAALIAATIAKQDIIITTALIPGKPAPRLVTAEMVDTLKPGSVIVDMAAEAGGNCEVTQVGQVVMKNGVTIVGDTHLTSRIATDASALYGRNLAALFGLLYQKDSGTIALNFEDEIIKAMTLTHGGEVVNT